MKAFFIALGNQLKAMVLGFVKALTISVSDLKRFFLILIGGLVTLDIALTGKTGVIKFLVKQTKELLLAIKDIFAAPSTGSITTIMLTIVLLVVILKKQE